ncbi:MFS transporter [Geomicrobium sp. JCM 19039]|uniref:MFS transporter n=1 Tax=Geomicrobium sp. JCM 19039 TaxID=1460636 RepID=UPI00126791D2|nr:MFS transporter [Geomicrobium sp. JCM 19039]
MAVPKKLARSDVRQSHVFGYCDGNIGVYDDDLGRLGRVGGPSFIAMLFTINNTTFYQKRVPEHLRGRVFAVRTILAQAGIPLGAGVGGLLAEAYNFTVLFIILGGLILLSTILAWSHKIFYELNKEHTMTKGVSHGD